MKKRKSILSLLIAFLCILTPVIPVNAGSDNYVELESGSTSAKIEFTVEEILSLHGTVSTSASTGFKPVSISASGTEAGTLVQTSPEGNKIILVGGNLAADVKFTVQLESSSPMKDGEYTVNFAYAKTDKDGSYDTELLQTAIIYVGIEAPEEEETSEDKESSDSKKDKNKKKDSETSTVTTVTTEDEEEEEESDRASMMEAEDGEGETIEEAEIVKEKSSGGLKLPWWLPILLIALLLLGILAFVLRRIHRKNKKTDYEGAPMVDYDIGDDDVETGGDNNGED